MASKSAKNITGMPSESTEKAGLRSLASTWARACMKSIRPIGATSMAVPVLTPPSPSPRPW
jgi:hypothetical protein